MGNTIGFMKAHASRVRALLRIEINVICGLVCLEVVHPDRKPTINKSATKWATTEAKTEWKTERRQQEMMMIVFGFVQWIGLVAGEFRNQKLENYEREENIQCIPLGVFVLRFSSLEAKQRRQTEFVCIYSCAVCVDICWLFTFALWCLVKNRHWREPHVLFGLIVAVSLTRDLSEQHPYIAYITSNIVISLFRW